MRRGVVLPAPLTVQAVQRAEEEGGRAPTLPKKTPTPMSPQKRISPELSSPRVLHGFCCRSSKKSLNS